MSEKRDQENLPPVEAGEKDVRRQPTPIRVFNAQTGIRFDTPFQKRVSGLLIALGMDEETVLVIQNDNLLLPGDRIDPMHEVEIRPVISGGSGK